MSAESVHPTILGCSSKTCNEAIRRDMGLDTLLGEQREAGVDEGTMLLPNGVAALPRASLKLSVRGRVCVDPVIMGTFGGS